VPGEQRKTIMPRLDINFLDGVFTPERKKSALAKLIELIAPAGALAVLTAGTFPALADTLSRSVDVNSTPTVVWSMIGPFCAVKDWHPLIGTCVLDGKAPLTRTLVTKDGTGTFVETQTANNNAEHLYSYVIKSGPLPLTQYLATLKVTANGKDISTVTWSSTYTPDKGKENNANAALVGIYESGLDEIKARFIK
jgi:hypothetical protein